ncbi:MAG: 2-dehydropantoate 2-reductase [Euryarchaeota archaeon]|nr:2-dehydropantoate 2-reductase [Euryarchaeota archaeon]
MRILIFGMGAIGSIFAARFSLKHDVVGICRGEHYEKVKRKGLEVKGATEGLFNIEVYKSVEEIPKKAFDIVIIATKSYELKKALNIVKRNLSFSYVMTLQNGFDVYDILLSNIDRERAIYAITYNAATLVAPGIVKHISIGDTIVKSLSGDPIEKTIVDALIDVGLPAKTSPDIMRDIWLKGTINCVINPITALFGKKNGIIYDKWDLLEDLILGIVEECVRAAMIHGVYLGEVDKILDLVKRTAKETSENMSSMLQDILKGRKTEIESLNCYVSKVLNDKGIKAPYNSVMCTIIKVLETLHARNA